MNEKLQLRERLREIENREREEYERIAKEKLDMVVGNYYKADSLDPDQIVITRFFKGGSYSRLLREVWFYYHGSYYGVKVGECWNFPNMEDCDKQITKTEFNKLKNEWLSKL